MPLYELVAIASHYDKFKPIRDLVRSTALHIMEHGGEVRSIKSWGTLPLPETMRRHKVVHSFGDYYVMRFDCSPVTLQALDAAYKADPRVIRWTNIKLGSSLKQLTTASPSRTTGWGSDELDPRYPRPATLHDSALRAAASAAFSRAPKPAAQEDDMFAAMEASYGAGADQQKQQQQQARRGAVPVGGLGGVGRQAPAPAPAP